ncbi:MAG: chemotaxis protein CheA [Dehalococcoidia bacterium]
MTLDIDISADDLKVFLQEVEGLLDLLDEDIIRLEQESSNEDLLQEIFRAAHTLKGSSGMLGFQEMTGLTHAMEDLLDRVRKGSLAVTADLVDALLMSLDGLKVLKNDLAAGEKTSLQIEPIVSALEACAAAGASPEQSSQGAASVDAIVLADAELAARIEAATADGPVLRVSVELAPESEWAAVRCFQVLNELDGKGEVLVSAPTQEDVEREQVGHTLEALITGTEAGDDLIAIVSAVEDVTSVTVDAWEGPSEEAAAAAASAPAGREQDATPEVGAKIDDLSQSVRIDVAVLDELMNLVGELVIDRTRVGQISRVLSSRHKDDEEVRALGETSAHFLKVIDVLHENMMQVRMLPVGVLFSKFPRLVRDLARNSGKNVSLAVEGEDTEIDRTVIEEMKDPLVHLIRNALDHGIESPEDRAAAGKPEMSVLRLSARHAQGQIVITLTDDGQGIDSAAVLESALRKGALSTEAAERLSESEVVDLIFEPGLSTAKKTTEVSGRGVGMDIVRRNIESLSGRVEVETEVGRGTTFTLYLPLTLATFRGLLVDAGGTLYAIPLSYVQETMRPDRGDIHTVTGRRVMNLRGTVMSLISLSDTLANQNGDGRSIGGMDLDRCFVVVVRASESENDRPVAIAVDALVDQQEVLVKSLGDYMGRARGVAGASILGDGQVVLILDVPSLIKAAQQGASEMADVERGVSR